MGEAARPAQHVAGRSRSQCPDRVGDQAERREGQAEERDLQRRMTAVRLDELGQEGEKEQRRLGVEDVDDHPLCKDAAQPPLAAESDLLGRRPRQQSPQSEPDQVRGAGVLDRCEGRRGGDQERREAGRRGRDVHERAQMDPEHGDETGPLPLVDRPRDDVEHRRPRHGEERQSGGGKERQTIGGDDHAFRSHTSRSPSRVRKGSTRAIVAV